MTTPHTAAVSPRSLIHTPTRQADRQTGGDRLKEAERLKDIRATNSSNSPLVAPALWRPITVISAAYFSYSGGEGGLYIPPLKCRVNSHHIPNAGTVRTHVHLEYTLWMCCGCLCTETHFHLFSSALNGRYLTLERDERRWAGRKRRGKRGWVGAAQS